jgi:hypothetical protein
MNSSSIKCENSGRYGACGEDSVSCGSRGEGSQCLNPPCQEGTNCWDFSGSADAAIAACHNSGCGQRSSSRRHKKTCLSGGKIGNQEVYCCDQGGGESQPCNFDIENELADTMCRNAGKTNDIPLCDGCDCGPGQVEKRGRKHGGNFGQNGNGGKGGNGGNGGKGGPLGPGGQQQLHVMKLSDWNIGLGIGSAAVALGLLIAGIALGHVGLAVVAFLVLGAFSSLFFLNVIQVNESFEYENLPPACPGQSGTDVCADYGGCKPGGQCPINHEKVDDFVSQCCASPGGGGGGGGITVTYDGICQPHENDKVVKCHTRNNKPACTIGCPKDNNTECKPRKDYPDDITCLEQGYDCDTVTLPDGSQARCGYKGQSYCINNRTCQKSY